MNEILHPQDDLVIVSSHRGDHALVNGLYPKIPENSLQAIGKSATEGAEEIELDVKLTSDGVPILSHDLSWGREWCGTTLISPGTWESFNPFFAPGQNSYNDAKNPAVSATSLANTRSFFGFTVLRDTISITTNASQGCFPGNTLYGEYPPTLLDALNYMTEHKIAMVLALDIRDATIAKGAWTVISDTKDYLGRSYAQSTLFKIPAKAFSSPSAVVSTFPGQNADTPAYFQPVYNTGDISPTVFGSEQEVLNDLRDFEENENIIVAGVEVQIKQVNGILTSVLNGAKTDYRTGQRKSVTVFSPYVDYYDPSDTNHTTPLFFKTTGFCCQKLSDFFYNGAPNGQPSDTADNRGDLNYLLQQGFNSITYDNPADYTSRLAAVGKRNLSRIKGSTSGRAQFSTCDLYAVGGTPCVAAHSTVRALFSTYSGNLYQVSRDSDHSTVDIEALASSGYADAAKQDSFCAGTTCTITKIYDQTFYQNDLTIEGPGGTVKTPDVGASATALPITLHGNKVYGVSVTSGVGYRRNATTGVARGASPEGIYMVTSGTNVNSGCCFDYGNAETNSADNGNGHMDALNFGTFCGFTCTGSGPWVEVDMENGQYQGNGSNTGDQPISSNFVTAMSKNNGQTAFGLKAGNAQSGTLTTEYSGSLPTVKSGYTPMSLEGAIVLGTGGDNSDWGIGSFFEGAMTAGTPSDETEDAVQANIVAAGYGGSSNPNGDTGGSTYTGPDDPNGPGPQDALPATANVQGNELMGSKPAFSTFKGNLYVAFQANDASHNLYVSAVNGNVFPPATGYPNVKLGSAPTMAEFNNRLYVAFQSDDSSHNLYVTSSASGSDFPDATGYPDIQIGSAPAMAVFNNQLYIAFQANDAGHTLHVTSSSDGSSWPAAAQVPNVSIGSAPAMVAFNGKLYVAFRADDRSNDVWIASSSDGLHFSSQVLTGQKMGGESAPALVVANKTLYYIYGANDTANEMLVTASTDGSTWQGPKVYRQTHIGDSGPAAVAFANGFTVGFQSNDARNVLFTSSDVSYPAATYTGPNDPNGSGPQDGFNPGADGIPAVYMGSKPALASFKDSLYVAFQANDASHNLFITSSTDGANFPAATGYPNIQIGGAPAAAVFNSKMYIAFQANDAGHTLHVTSSSDGSTWPAAAQVPNVQIGSAPAMTEFNKKLFVAFQSDDLRHLLFLTSSSDGTTWPGASAVPNVKMGSAPSMAAFNGKLYVAFRADDASNDAWIASSSDGATFDSQTLPGQTMGWSSAPALYVVGQTMYYIYGANDNANEMLVMSTTDGSTWQGPAVYPNVHFGYTGPAATLFHSAGEKYSGSFVGFQSNDARDLLFLGGAH